MPIISLRTALCLVTAVLCNVHSVSPEHEIPRRSFLSRRAIDGTRGRKFFDPEEEGTFDSYGSAGGQYDPYEERTDLSDIRRNVPGEPGIDYPAYARLPQTGFTCEGRSRGYYADEVSGCQVFHVCHDVLVSSFLCPIGSIFSQKLLTCDWWSKVDCSATEKYIDVNRNSYQQDDDEMIRNAYAMISVRSGTDLTKDGLVDPDRTGSVIDYHGRDGRNGRIDYYSTLDTTGNDLRAGSEDYSTSHGRVFLPNYDPYKERKADTSGNYQERFYPRDKSQSPYHDSPIIRIQKIGDTRNYGEKQKARGHGENTRDDYQRPNQFSDQFQPSYAPTVPTVTTTTRRFYSPTVPTTFRPSTLAYNKLDQIHDSSDYYFTRDKTNAGLVTSPTRIFPSDDARRRQSLAKTDVHTPARIDGGLETRGEGDYHDYGDDSRSNRSDSRVRQNESPWFGEAYRDVEDEGSYEDSSDERIEDIETRDSIGLGHALRQPLDRTSIREKNPLGDDNSKSGRDGSAYKRTDVSRDKRIDGIDDAAYLRASTKEEEDSNTLIPSTTPLFVHGTTEVITTTSSPIRFLSNPEETSDSKRNSNEQRISPDSVEVEASAVPQAVEFSKANHTMNSSRANEFRVAVPDTSDPPSRLPALFIDDGHRSIVRSTESPRRDSTYDESATAATSPTFHDYENEEERSTLRYYSTTDGRVEISTVAPWFGSSIIDKSEVKVPLTDFIPPVVDYNDGYDDFIAPEETAGTNDRQDQRFNFSSTSEKDEERISLDRNSGLKLIITDDARERFSSKVSLCSYDGSGEPCDKERIIIDDKVPITTPIPLIRTNLERTVSPAIRDAGLPEYLDERVTERSNVITLTPKLESERTVAGNPKFLESRFSIAEEDKFPENPKGRSKETKEDTSKEIVEVSTLVDESLRTIPVETPRPIEETHIREKNSPYLVPLIARENQASSIARSIGQSDKQSFAINDKVEGYQIVKSIESEIPDSAKPLVSGTGDTDASSGPKKLNTSINRLSLVQLMAELLKLDRIPRPFAPSIGQSARLTMRTNDTFTKDVDPERRLADESISTPDNASTESIGTTSRPRLKERILGQLTDNFGRSLYRANRQPIFELPEIQRSLDFQTGLPIHNSETNDEPSGIGAISSTTVRTNRSDETDVVSITTTTGNIVNTEKTIVKTEFVPSIGFSFDTDEGREEYAEAVLGGLINEHAEKEIGDNVTSALEAIIESSGNATPRIIPQTDRTVDPSATNVDSTGDQR